jgi:hypothetical protein
VEATDLDEGMVLYGLNAGLVKLAGELDLQKRAFKVFLDSLDDTAISVVSNGWKFDPNRGKELLSFMDTVLAFVWSRWQKDVAEAAETLAKSVPPPALTDSGQLLTDKATFSTLSGAVKLLNDSGVMRLAKDYQDLVSGYESHGGEPNHINVDQLARARATARRVIAIEWTCSQILGFKPESPADIAKTAVTITSKLKCKGVGTPKGILLPVFLVKALERMAAHKPESTSAESGVGDGPPAPPQLPGSS